MAYAFDGIRDEILMNFSCCQNKQKQISEKETEHGVCMTTHESAKLLFVVILTFFYSFIYIFCYSTRSCFHLVIL